MHAQNACVDTIQVLSTYTTTGNTMAVDIAVTGFTNIQSMQFLVSYDTSVVDFQSSGNYNLPGMTSASFAEVTDGEIRLIWIDNTASNPVTLPELSQIFTLYFDVISSEDPNINIGSTSGFPAEISNADNDILCINDLGNNSGGGGSGNGNGNGSCVDTVYLSAVLDTDNATTSIDITVEDFEDISSMQFLMNYDPSVLDFTSTSDYALSGLSAVSFNEPTNGEIRVVWTDNTGLTPATLADQTILFTLHFDNISSDDPNFQICSSDQFPAEIANSQSEVLCIPDLCTSTGGGNGNDSNDPIPCLDVNLSLIETDNHTIIDVQVNEFDSITSLTLEIDYNESLLNFEEFINTNSLLGLDNTSLYQQDGKIFVNWEASTTEESVSIPNGTSLFQIQFEKYSGDSQTLISFTNQDLGNSAAHARDEDLCMDFNTVVLGTNPSNCVDSLIIDLVGTNGSTSLSIDFETYNFEDIASLQFSIEYDDTHLTFESIEAGALNVGPSSINSNTPGTINFAWIDNTVQGLSIADGSSLFTINFTSSSNNASEVSITSNPIPVEISKIINNQVVEICLVSDQVELLSEGALLSGYIRYDEDANCTDDPMETPMQDWIVQFAAPQDTFYSNTDNEGYYQALVVPGTYTVSAISPNELWSFCENDIVSVTAQNGDIDEIDFYTTAVESCSLLDVSLSTPFLRRCFDNTYVLEYCNTGTTTAAEAYIELILDENLDFISTDHPDYEVGSNGYTFNLGDVAPFTCAKIKVVVNVSCESVLGQTHCSEAIIYPNNDCSQLGSNYDGASLRVSGECDNDSVRFNIQNVGIGDMIMPSEFIVIEDDVMFNKQEINLPSGEQESFAYAADGATFRVNVNQVNGHPGASNPTAVIEGCDPDNDSDFSLGYVLMFPEDDNDAWISSDCQENIGSYDPNDKNAFPRGYGDEHYIKKNTDLEFKIRFQNTGTDTAFKVEIVDTLSRNLDIRSLKVGAASHDYEMILRNQELRFVFNNIKLVDSTTNEPGSHGFITYSIKQKPNLEDGEEIFNKAGIYFDFNEPIITNETFHLIGTNFMDVQLSVDDPTIVIASKIYPNPILDEATLELEDQSNVPKQLEIFSAQGQLLKRMNQRSSTFNITREGLATGTYIYKVRIGNQAIAYGTLIVL